jgi:hypothetical protein
MSSIDLYFDHTTCEKIHHLSVERMSLYAIVEPEIVQQENIRTTALSTSKASRLDQPNG